MNDIFHVLPSRNDMSTCGTHIRSMLKHKYLGIGLCYILPWKGLAGYFSKKCVLKTYFNHHKQDGIHIYTWNNATC